MLSENSNKQKKSLSIHYFKNGFSFCTNNSLDFFSHPDYISEFEYSVRNFLDKNHITQPTMSRSTQDTIIE